MFLVVPGLGRSIQRTFISSERVRIWVCLFLNGWSLPWCEDASLGVFDLIRVMLTYSNGAVQAHAGLDLADPSRL